MYGAFLKNLLEPLGVYDLRDGSLNAAELAALGEALDRVNARLEHAEREALSAPPAAESV